MKKQIADLEKKHTKESVVEFDIGDTIDVHFKIKEESKTRIHVFTGIVIGRRGTGTSETFTVRRISYGEGVERIFPIQSPLVDKIVVKKKGRVRRAKLYYLRDKKGKKATRVREKIVQKNESEK